MKTTIKNFILLMAVITGYSYIHTSNQVQAEDVSITKTKGVSNE